MNPRPSIAMLLAVLAGLAALTATGMALVPYGGPPDALQHPVHALAFAVISLLFALALPKRPWGGLLAALALGGLIEGAQVFIPGRSAGLDDLAANLAGVIMGAVAYFLIRTIIPNKHSSAAPKQH